MNSGIVLEFDASHHAVVVLLAVPSARTPLLKLYWQRATSVLPRCVCYLAHLGPHLNSQSSEQFFQGDPGLSWGLSGFN